jgi:thiamine pyrophosphate-dependent acetolactate synthase large subunit-like protein
MGIVGDVKIVLKALTAKLSRREHKAWGERVKYIKGHPDNNLEMDSGRLTPQSVIRAYGRMGDNVVLRRRPASDWTTQ